MSGEPAANRRSDTLERFTTDRISATRVVESDYSDLRGMDTDPRIMDTMGGVRTEPETRAYLRTNLEHWEVNGFGLWMLRLLDDDSLAGRAYLRHLHIAGNDEIAIGYALLPTYWGRGLATEIAGAIVRLAFDDLGLEDVVLGVLPANSASTRVIEKIGGIYELDADYKGHTHKLYRVTRPS